MYRFALIGGGWRAEFYARIARALPDRFELVCTYLRDKEKLNDWCARFGGSAAASLGELSSYEPDFIVVSLPTDVQADMLGELLDMNIPLLCETPLWRGAETMEKVTALAKGREHLIDTAEQYMDWPMYRAWKNIIDLGLIGNVWSVTAGALHGYHAVSAIRALLGTGFEKVRMIGFSRKYPIVKTGDRSGIVYNGPMSEYTRDTVQMDFESGKTALYDFTGELHHTRIMERTFVIRGDRGEISWDTVRYLNSDGMPVTQRIERDMLGYNDNNKLCLNALTLGERYLWRNPFGYARLNDDELAVACLMDRMGRRSRGENVTAYPFSESVRDAEVSQALYASAQADGKWTEI